MSIKLLESNEDRVLEDKYNDWGSSISKKVLSKAKLAPADDDTDFDEEKPIFRVPVLLIKHMNRFQSPWLFMIIYELLKLSFVLHKGLLLLKQKLIKILI